MTAVTNRTFMSSLCQVGRPGIDKPFAMDGFDCATNGHALLMMPGATYEPNPNAPPVSEIAGMKLKKIATVEFKELRIWSYAAGALNQSCETCGAESDLQEITAGLLAGRLVNRRLLGKCLRLLTAERVEIHVGDELDPVLIKCADWRLFVMPVRQAAGDSYEFPVPKVLERAASLKATKGPK